MAKMQRTYPTFLEEQRLIEMGFSQIGGVDEVGRGCFAGPVVAACVVFNEAGFTPEVYINDSKKLTASQRHMADIWIRQKALAFGIGLSTVNEINKYGIKKATESAFRRAVKKCGANPDFLLTDAFYIPRIRGIPKYKQKAIIKGDALSLTIASASIVAKVYRDNLMQRLSKKPNFAPYLWHKNKGYGTREHREIILKLGITSQHRNTFVSTWLSKA
jgi:ribonuclease HII